MLPLALVLLLGLLIVARPAPLLAVGAAAPRPGQRPLLKVHHQKPKPKVVRKVKKLKLRKAAPPGMARAAQKARVPAPAPSLEPGRAAQVAPAGRQEEYEVEEEEVEEDESEAEYEEGEEYESDESEGEEEEPGVVLTP